MELREAGYDDEIVLFAEEPEVPYERPPLSKGFLQGENSRESTYVQPREWYAEHDVELRLGEPVDEHRPRGADRALEAGHHPFDKLLIATGARPRTLDLASTDAIDVRYLRTLADSTALRERLGPERHLLVLGGWLDRHGGRGIGEDARRHRDRRGAGRAADAGGAGSGGGRPVRGRASRARGRPAD